MDITIPQKKKHLLLLNRIMRAELKKDIIPTPSKLTEEEVNQYFNKLFVKKDDYYVPIKTKAEIMIDEELFKDLVKKPKAIKTKEEKKQEKDTQKEKEKEMKVNIINGLYNKFNNDFVKPYESKKRAGTNFKEEEQKMINRYIKYGDDVKKLIKIKLPPLWEAVLNKAYLEREKRKEGLVEEEMKLKDEIKKEAKKKTDIKKQLEEVKQTFKEGILYKINKLIIDLKKYENDLDDFIKNRKDLFMNIYKNIPDKQKPKNKKEAQKTADKINNNLNEKQYNIEKEIGNIFKELIKIKTDNDILLNKDELDFIDENKIETISTKEYKEMKRKAEDIEKKRIEDEKEFNRELTKEETIKKYGSYLIDKSKMPIRNTLHILDDIINKKSILELVYDNSYVRPDGTRVDGAYIIIKKLIENNIDLSKPIFKDLIKALKEEYKGDIFNLKETFNIDY